MPYARRALERHVTTVILDFGGVLGLPLDPRHRAEMAALCGLPVAEFQRLYVPDRHELDRGTLPGSEYWRRILAAGGKEATPELVARIEEIDTRGWLEVNHRVVAWTRELKAEGYRTGLLSNMPHEKRAFLRREQAYRWLGDFDAVVFSCDYALVKPEPEIYRLCLSKLGAQPAECLFVDDTPVNVDAARALGFQGLLFRDVEQAAPLIQTQWGIPVRSLLG